MKLQQIAHIKEQYTGLKMNKHATTMFADGKWGTAFKIDMLHTHELTSLFEYSRTEGIKMFIGSGVLFMQ